MTFNDVDLIPQTTSHNYLGSSKNKWKINGIDDPKLTDTTYENATTSSDGLMSSTDKNKVDKLSTNGGAPYLQTFKSNSKTETYGDSYPIYAQWKDGNNVALKCDNYVTWVDKATDASTVNGLTVNTAVPSNAVFTDTKNTAGSTDTSSKIFLVGATSQAANPQTYSDNEIYATNGVLTTKSVQVGGTAATMQYNATNKCIDFVFA